MRRLGDTLLSRVGGRPAGGWIQRATFEGGVIGTYPDGFNSVTGSGVTAAGAAAKNGAYGCSIAVTDTSARYGTLSGPSAQRSMTLQFWLNLNSMTMAANDTFVFVRIVDDGVSGEFARIEIQKTAGGDYQFRPFLVTDAGGYQGLTQFTFDATKFINVKMVMTIGSSSGAISVYVDDVLKGNRADVDNPSKRAGDVTIGCISGMDAGTSGTYYLDDIFWK